MQMEAAARPKRGRFRKLQIAVALLALLSVAVAIKAWRDTLSEPTVLRATVTLPQRPAGTPPIRLALLSDIHVAGPDMPPERRARIVAQVNALKPDLVLIAGDLVSEKRFATHI